MRLGPRTMVTLVATLGILPATVAIAETSPATKLFRNPVLGAGQDPSVVTNDGRYYYTQSAPDSRSITIRSGRSIKSLAGAAPVLVWRGGKAGSPCCEWWAPELHEIGGRWFIYVAADDGQNRDHRLQVLEARRPLGPYHYRGRLATPGNFWSIDPSPLELPGGKLLLFWSGWPTRISNTQNIYVAAMRNPWTVAGKRVAISTPTYPWERHSGHLGVNVNESPEPIVHGSTVSVTYSASACWTPYYSIGLLSAPLGARLLNAAVWRKSTAPLFRSNGAARIYGPASNGWFTSPDGRQTWLVFDAVRDPHGNCGGERQNYAQRVRWNSDGTPNLGGEPLPIGRLLRVPSGDPGAR